MGQKMLSDAEKRKLISEVLGGDHNVVGKNYQALSKFIDNVSKSSDVLSAAELLPYVSSLLSRPMASAFISNLSFVSAILFPLGQLINVVNAYQVGHRMYAYRSIAYTITAWAYNRPIPTGSPQILFNIRHGDQKKDPAAINEYNKIWAETSRNVIRKLDSMALEYKVPKDKLKTIFRVFGNNRMDALCRDVLISFERHLNTTYRNVWKSNYSTCYPQ